MKNVLMVISDTNIGGAGKWILEYFRYHNKEHFRVKAVVPTGSKLKALYEGVGLPVIECDGIADVSYHKEGVKNLYRIFQKERPDIVHAHGTMSARVAAAKWGSNVKKIVYTRHSVFEPTGFFTKPIGKLVNRIITAMTDREISLIVEELALDDTTELLKELPANMVHRIMKNATPETRTDINRLLAYPEDSAGSVMTAEFIDLRRDMTCAEAIARIRKTGVDKETVYVAYVVDHHRVLQGAVPLKDLLFASADDLIEDIMDEDIICASTMDDQETVASTVAKYDLLAIPIVDREYRLVGIVTVDDAIDVMETEATEDIEKMAAISPTDKPYLRTGVFETWKKRVPWLLLLMLSATFTSTILAHYEGILDAATLSLAVFVPMLTGTGGNASSQTSVTVIRGLSLGEIEMGDIFRVLWKELRVASVCGITVAAACFAKTMLVDLKLVFTVDTIEVAAIVSATMFCAVVFAKLMGVLLPIGAKRVGLDPAVMASPFITTIVDALSLLLYFSIASPTVLHV